MLHSTLHSTSTRAPLLYTPEYRTLRGSHLRLATRYSPTCSWRIPYWSSLWAVTVGAHILRPVEYSVVRVPQVTTWSGTTL